MPESGNPRLFHTVGSTVLEVRVPWAMRDGDRRGNRQETKGELWGLEEGAGEPKSWALHLQAPGAGE